MVGKRSRYCCKSTSTPSCCCQNDCNLRGEDIQDLAKISDYEYDADTPPWNTPVNVCPSSSNAGKDLVPKKKRNKEHVQIKLIEHKKPRKTEDPKILTIIPPKPCSSGFNDIARKAVSALSNCISYIFPATSTAERVEQENEEEEEQRNETIKQKQPERKETRAYKNVDEENNKKTMKEKKIEENTLEAFQQVDDTSKGEPRSSRRPRHIVDDSQQGRTDDLIENFKMKALNADDEMFDKLLEKLKKELHLLACTCPSVDPRVIKPNIYEQFEEKEEVQYINDAAVREVAGQSDTNKNCMTKDELNEILSELKVLLEKNFCECDKKEDGAKLEALNVNEMETNTGLAGNRFTCLEGGEEGCECKKRKEEEKNMSELVKEEKTEKNTTDIVTPDFTEFYNKIMSKLDEISDQRFGEAGHSSKKNTISREKSKTSNISEVSEESTISINGGSLVHSKGSSKSNSTLSSNSKRKEKKREEKKKEPSNENDKVDNKTSNGVDEVEVEKDSSPAKNDANSIPLEEFVNLADELKEALGKSACKCTQSPGTECANGEMNVLQKEKEVSADSDDTFVSLPPIPEPTLLERVAADTFNLSDLFEKPVVPMKPVLESPAESFYSASSNEQKPNVKEVEIGVNTQCKCLTDKVVQTFEDIEVSGVVVCVGQSKNGDEERPKVTDVQIRRKMSQDGEVERIKVRVQLNNGKIEAETPEVVYRKENDMVDRSSKFIKTFADYYRIKYETTETDIEEPKIVTDGDQIKIFIPLKCDATHPCDSIGGDGKPKFSSSGIEETVN
ncbi:uncharacterized protein LOC123316576 isoform X3 [Coccinella septempunctata]|uniref:uncharacterized protein LOC123316576 isoform X3 n=1 Tax=Coccinella septempunctata TaxID=41139 RepID=UPI001D060768|nr:uncharacterized protein LOC123316576 isoform X3 [Coccinella septempunctata]